MKGATDWSCDGPATAELGVAFPSAGPRVDEAGKNEAILGVSHISSESKCSERFCSDVASEFTIPISVVVDMAAESTATDVVTLFCERHPQRQIRKQA